MSVGEAGERLIEIEVPESGVVSGLLRHPGSSRALLALAHGAGAGMRHAFMEAMADRLAERDVATLRYQFPYMEAGRKRPDRPPVAQAAVRAAVATAAELADGLPLYAGGKSFGGRMTSGAVAGSPLDGGGGPDGLSGLIFLGFPLHPAGRPGTDRADHLRQVDLPMLFIQGTRDALADLELLRPILAGLGQRAMLHVVEGGDHSFKVLKRSGRTDAEALDEIADAVAAFVGRRG